MMFEYTELPAARTAKAGEPRATYATGLGDGKRFRESGKYSQDEVAAFLRRNSRNAGPYTKGFCEGLRP